MWSCQSSGKKVVVKPKDTLVAALPRPTLDPAEYKKYHDLVSAFVANNLSEKHFSGGILIAKNGVPVYERYSGFANPRTKDSINSTTPFQIASTGKTLTAAAILKLIQEGKMGLNDSLTHFFPGFPYP